MLQCICLIYMLNLITIPSSERVTCSQLPTLKPTGIIMCPNRILIFIQLDEACSFRDRPNQHSETYCMSYTNYLADLKQVTETLRFLIYKMG